MMATVVPIRAGGPAAVTTAELRAGAGVLALEGFLCREAGRACSRGMVMLLQGKPRTFVLDLSGASAGPGTTELLDTMRHHAAHHGVDLWLAAVPADVAAQLATGGDTEPFRVVPTADAAVRCPDEGASGAVACLRPAPSPASDRRTGRH